MALFASLLLVLGLASSPVLGSVPFKLQDCTDHTDLLTLSNVHVTPYPVAVPGDLTITGALTLNRNATGSISLDLTIKRYLGLFWLTVPCISEVGSCTYKDACGMLDTSFGAGSGAVCPPQVTAAGLPCACPIPKGTYTMDKTVVIIPELTGLWSSLAEGDYRITAKLIDNPTGHVLTCQHLEVTIVDGHPKCSGFLCSIFG